MKILYRMKDQLISTLQASKKKIPQNPKFVVTPSSVIRGKLLIEEEHLKKELQALTEEVMFGYRLICCRSMEGLYEVKAFKKEMQGRGFRERRAKSILENLINRHLVFTCKKDGKTYIILSTSINLLEEFVIDLYAIDLWIQDNKVTEMLQEIITKTNNINNDINQNKQKVKIYSAEKVEDSAENLYDSAENFADEPNFYTNEPSAHFINSNLLTCIEDYSKDIPIEILKYGIPYISLSLSYSYDKKEKSGVVSGTGNKLTNAVTLDLQLPTSEKPLYILYLYNIIYRGRWGVSKGGKKGEDLAFKTCYAVFKNYKSKIAHFRKVFLRDMYPDFNSTKTGFCYTKFYSQVTNYIQSGEITIPFLQRLALLKDNLCQGTNTIIPFPRTCNDLLKFSSVKLLTLQGLFDEFLPNDYLG